MHYLALLMLVACDGSLGYHSNKDNEYRNRNLIVREEPNNENGVLVECPVCDETEEEDYWMWASSKEVCPIVKGNKTYKKCEKGTYNNEVCGNRLDCFRGAGEKCTENRDSDKFGQRCAPGYHCNKHLGLCQGWDYVIDSKVQYMLNPTPYSFGNRFKNGLEANAFIRRDYK